MNDNITRFEVIDHREGGDLNNRGRVFVTGIQPNLKVEVSIQDEGRTMKVFLSDRKAEDE